MTEMNNKVDEDNGRGGDQENGRFRKLRKLSRNEFWKNIRCLLSTHLSPLGIKNVGEASKDKWEEEEEVFDSIEGLFV